MTKRQKNEFSDLDANEILKKVSNWEKEKKVFKKQPLGRIKITKAECDSIKKVEEDKKKELEKKEREEKRILEKQIEKKINNSKYNKFKNKKNKLYKNIKKKLLLEKDDKEFIKEFISSAFIAGLILNYVFFVLFNSAFIWYGFPAYGIAFWFILVLLPKWTRKFWESQIE